jgi:hypothetical protein
MKNTEKDYFTQLRSDYIPTKKNSTGNTKRPFNPGDPNEFLFMPSTPPAITESKTQLYSQGITPQGSVR